MLELNTKVNTDYSVYRQFMLAINFLFIHRKSVNWCQHGGVEAGRTFRN